MPKSRLKLGFDQNLDNSCYLTSTMAALFLSPSKLLQRFINRRQTRQKNLRHQQLARMHLLDTARNLASQEGQLSTEYLLAVREHLRQLDFAQQFSTQGPNDAVEWLEILFKIIDLPPLLNFAGKSGQSHILNLPVGIGQSLQQCLDEILADQRLLFAPGLLLINVQRLIKQTRQGSVVTQNYRIQIEQELSFSIRTRSQTYQLQSIVTMNQRRDHYCAYVWHHKRNRWLFLSDIGGQCQELPASFTPNLSESSSKQTVSISCNAHFLVYSSL